MQMVEIKTKVCSKCHQEKSIDQYYFRKETNKYRNYCIVCFTQKQRKYRVNNYEVVKINKRKSLLKHFETYQTYHKNYQLTHKLECLRNNLKYKKKKYTNPVYKFIQNIRNRTREGIKNNRTPTKKSQKTRDLLCCDWVYAKKHLEKQFRDGMTWENHGKVWHIDHIIPLAFFDMSDDTEQKLANHYGNLQPLFVNENLIKSNKIPEKPNFKY